MSLTKVSFSMTAGATLNVVDYPGANTGAKLIAAIAALPATGGIVDCRGLTGTHVISSTVVIGGTKPVTVLCSHGATFQPSSASVQMFHVKVDGQLIGATIDTTNVTYTSRAVLFDGEGVTTGDGNSSLIQDLIINGTVGEGTGLEVSTSGSSLYGIAFLTVDQIRIVGYFAGVNIYTNNAVQFINGNLFNNIQVKGADIGFNLSGNGDIRANQFMSCTYQASPTSTIGFNFELGIYNTFVNTNVWDMPAGANAYVFTSTPTFNRMSGYFGGSNYINNGAGNVVLDTVVANLPNWGQLELYTTPTVTWGVNFSPTVNAQNSPTLANNTTYDLAAGSGIVVLHSNTTGNIAMFLCAAGVTTLISDPSSSYSATLGTASKINLYYNAGTTSYRVQNLTGSSQTIFMSLMKTRPSV